MLTSSKIVLLALGASVLAAGDAGAQDPQIRVRSFERPAMVAYGVPSANRPVIGVSLSVGATGDTLGLEVKEVTADGPAAKAGITAGSRLQEINGVSLRISADDAADPATADAGYRRLQRELGKLKIGDDVTLRVLSGGQSRTVSVTTASAQELAGGTSVRWISPGANFSETRANRAALGISINSAGSVRDTLGVFISSVVTDGPAEKAGIVEGERIAAINGVDVRVPREDARDGRAGSARVSRFMREVEKASPGEKLTLRVFANGRYRDVEVTAVPASEVSGNSFFFDSGDMNLNIRRALEGVAVPMQRFERTTPRMTTPRMTAPPLPARAPAGVRSVRVSL